MIGEQKNVTNVSTRISPAVNFLFNAVMVSWVILFVGLLASFGLIFAGKAYSPASTVAGCLFVGGAVGFVAGMMSILVLDAPKIWALVKPEFCKSLRV